MRFATIIREAGLASEQYPKCSKVKIELYNEENQLILNSDIRFIDTLFAKAPESLKQFQDFLNELEAEEWSVQDTIPVMVNNNVVIVFYQTPWCKNFIRNPGSLDSEKK